MCERSPSLREQLNRSGAYLSIFVASLCLFATLLFLTYYLQRTLNYSPIATGFAFLPISVCLAVAANLSTIVLMPRVGPRPAMTVGLLIAAGAMAWLAQLGPHSSYVGGLIGPLVLAGFGLGMVVAPAINTGTFGVAPQDAGVASATVTVGQQLGASISTSLLNMVYATAIASYLVAHESSARLIGRAALNDLAVAYGYDIAFWWTCAIAAGGAVVAALLLRPGPLVSPAVTTAETRPLRAPRRRRSAIKPAPSRSGAGALPDTFQSIAEEGGHVTEEDAVNRLQSVDLFRLLAPFEIRRLVRASTTKRWGDGEEIVSEGGAPTGFFLILEGTGKVTKHGKQVDTVSANDYFGEISLIDGGARTASIMADGEVETMEISQSMFRTVIDAYPGMSHQVQLLLCRRIRDLEASDPNSRALD